MPSRTPWFLSPATKWRFRERVDSYGKYPDECHLWTGPPDPSTGYGQVNWVDVGGKKRVHVMAWEIEHGRLVPFDPDTGQRFDVDHTCHNVDPSCPGGKTCRHRLCCNPRHLRAIPPRVNKDAADEPRKRGRFRTHFDCGCEITEDSTYLITRKGTRNGKPRAPERRCKLHERAKQNARGEPAHPGQLCAPADAGRA